MSLAFGDADEYQQNRKEAVEQFLRCPRCGSEELVKNKVFKYRPHKEASITDKYIEEDANVIVLKCASCNTVVKRFDKYSREKLEEISNDEKDENFQRQVGKPVRWPGTTE